MARRTWAAKSSSKGSGDLPHQPSTDSLGLLRTRTFAVEVRADNPTGRIRAGMIARVHLTREVIADAIMVPLEVLTPLGTDGEPVYAVYVVADGRASRRVVSISLLRGQQAQVLPAPGQVGLQPGDHLIVKGHRSVSEGQKVHQLPNPQASSRPTTEPAVKAAAAPLAREAGP